MEKEKITKEELIGIFDECQEAFNKLDVARNAAASARTEENNALNDYERAKKKWNEANERFLKGLK